MDLLTDQRRGLGLLRRKPQTEAAEARETRIALTQADAIPSNVRPGVNLHEQVPNRTAD